MCPAPFPFPRSIATVDGVEFVEFALDEASGDDLAVFLGHLGFRRAGSHRSKAVDLFRQGRINLLLNSELDSAASYHFQLRTGGGSAITPIGADLPRASAAVCRT
ncbi:MAG: hypothetical protein WCA23_27165 [Stellaceae bacterium]